MSESLKKLAASTGVDADTIEKVLGGVLSFLKTRIDGDAYATIETKVPEARRVATDFAEAQAQGEPGEEAQGARGGLLGQVTALAGKVLGGDSGGGDLLEKLLKLGVPVGSVTTILPLLLTYLKAHLPPDVLKQIAAALPAVPGVDTASLFGVSDDTVDYPTPAGDRP